MESHNPLLHSTSFPSFRRNCSDLSTWSFRIFSPCVFSRGIILSYSGLFLSDFYLLCSVPLFLVNDFVFGIFYGVMWLSCKCFLCWIFTLLVKILWFDIFSLCFFPFFVLTGHVLSCEPGVSLYSSWFSYENHLSRFCYVRDWRAIIFDGTSSWLSFSWPFLATWFRIVIWFGSSASELGELFIGSVVLTEPF